MWACPPLPPPIRSLNGFAPGSKHSTATASSGWCCSARGRAATRGRNSDYDVAVFLKDLADRWQELDRIVPLVTDILYDDDAFIHAMPYRAGSDEDRTSLMREIRREGVDL